MLVDDVLEPQELGAPAGDLWRCCSGNFPLDLTLQELEISWSLQEGWTLQELMVLLLLVQLHVDAWYTPSSEDAGGQLPSEVRVLPAAHPPQASS